LKNKYETVSLVSPRFNQVEVFDLGINLQYLFFGPLMSLYHKRFFEFFWGVLFTFLSVGAYWIYFSFKVNKVIVCRKVGQGYTPLGVNDQVIVNYLMKGKEFKPSSIKFSRLGSVDGRSK